MRYVWKARVLPGKLEEYKKRHDEIWPEMTEVLNQAGIHNYTIWNHSDELFGYYECDDLEFYIQCDNGIDDELMFDVDYKVFHLYLGI